MNIYLLLAGGLSILLGLVHSVLGELLVFQKLRQGGIVPTKANVILSERNIRIVWASWHVVTVCALGFGIILCRQGFPESRELESVFIKNTIMLSMFSSSALVLLGTKGRHPGWLVLLIIAILIWAA